MTATATTAVARPRTTSDTGTASLVRIARLGRPLTGRLALAAIVGAGTGAAAIGLMSTSAWLIARAAERPPVLYLMVAVTGVRAFGIARGVLRYLERLCAHDAAFRVLGEIRARVYVQLERLAPAGLWEFHSGDLLARVVGDVDALADVWLRVLLPYASAALAALLAVVVVGVLSPEAGFAVAAALLAAALVAPVVGIALTGRTERSIAPVRGELASAVLDLLAGAPELIASGAAARAFESVGAADGGVLRAESAASHATGTAALVAGLAAGAGVWLALVSGIASVAEGAIGPVGLAVVAITPLAANELIAGLGPAAVHVPTLASAARRVDAIFRRTPPVDEPATPAALPAGPYGLRIRGLRVRYPEGGVDILDGLDVDIAPGTRTLVTGPSGSGKSSFAAALLRFLEPSSGSIELVGTTGTVDLASTAGSEVRKVIGLCEQDPHVFDSTLGENVRLARPEATEQEIQAALSAAQLSSWIAGLPEGLDTAVGEHGARLSGGQRQRLAVARAILAQVAILVLDEPTEHVDEAMAATLVTDLLAAARDRTLIVLTHRPELMGSVEWDTRIDLGARRVSRT